MSGPHRYTVECEWQGSTGAGYEHYDRAHRVAAPPAEPRLDVTADPAFRGDARLLNPEQLLVAAAASCQLLSFLAVAARARIDVVDYSDHAEGFMPDDDPPRRVTRIVLRPRIRVRGSVDEQRLRHLCDVAHHECFIANSVTSEIVVEPQIVVEP